MQLSYHMSVTIHFSTASEGQPVYHRGIQLNITQDYLSMCLDATVCTVCLSVSQVQAFIFARLQLSVLTNTLF